MFVGLHPHMPGWAMNPGGLPPRVMAQPGLTQTHEYRHGFEPPVPVFVTGYGAGRAFGVMTRASFSTVTSTSSPGMTAPVSISIASGS